MFALFQARERPTFNSRFQLYFTTTCVNDPTGWSPMEKISPSVEMHQNIKFGRPALGFDVMSQTLHAAFVESTDGNPRDAVDADAIWTNTSYTPCSP